FLAGRPFLARLLLHLVDEGRDFALAAGGAGELEHERVLDGEAHERGTEKRVRPRGEHRDVARPSRPRIEQPEAYLRSHALADPVSLHAEHALGPTAGETIAAFEQLLGVGGDAEEPLLQRAQLDLRAAPPAQIGRASCRE